MKIRYFKVRYFRGPTPSILGRQGYPENIIKVDHPNFLFFSSILAALNLRA